MKHVPKSQPEPQCLSGFRQAQPEATWEDFKDTACSETVLDRTVTDQGGLCAYCERLLDQNDQQIAHFHPKSDRPEPPNPPAPVNWGLHWPNLWLACKGGDQAWMQNPDAYLKPASENRSCDVAKDDHVVDGQVLAPDQVPASPRIFEYRQSTDRLDIIPDEANCDRAGVSVDLAEATVNTFKLNCRRLSEARMRVHKAIENQIKSLRQKSAVPETLFPSLVHRHLARNANGEWKPFFTMVRWRFGATAEACLQSINYQG
ncbi:retron system putative HNH endonuclease [Prosthecobacter sp.]|uniref:retron system putative HNH endonuclease n=1 Tax=Prosthecobacter sp. TaxID=1965333 RepID=UPI003783C0DE